MQAVHDAIQEKAPMFVGVQAMAKLAKRSIRHIRRQIEHGEFRVFQINGKVFAMTHDFTEWMRDGKKP